MKETKEIEIKERSKVKLEGKIVLANGESVEFVAGPDYWERNDCTVETLQKTEEFIEEISELFTDWAVLSGEVDEKDLEEK